MLIVVDSLQSDDLGGGGGGRVLSSASVVVVGVVVVANNEEEVDLSPRFCITIPGVCPVVKDNVVIGEPRLCEILAKTRGVAAADVVAAKVDKDTEVDEEEDNDTGLRRWYRIPSMVSMNIAYRQMLKV